MAVRYELRVGEHLDERWSVWFGPLELDHRPDGTTTLRGAVTDQAELHGLLAKVRDLGVSLISVGPEQCHDVHVSTPLDAISWPVRTDRLTLRPATTDDIEATWRFRRREDVGLWLTRAPATLDEHRSHFEAPESLAKTVVVQLDGEVIGDLMLQVEDAWGQAEVEERARGVQAELGWVLHPDHAGRGYATEALRELIRLCFDVLGLRRVTAYCFAANEASWRLMERVGMRRETYTVRDSLHRSGEWLDGMGYALLSDEWRGS
ncbi:MAG TPA: GNAT family protein [Marmoricola sp.]|nr:GNAT family protein [Marmoricola sp.]